MNVRILHTIFCVTILANWASVQAQDISPTHFQKKISLLAIQVNFSLFMLDFKEGPFIASFALTEDVDFLIENDRTGGQSRIGLQIGLSQFDWPDMDAPEKDRASHGYSAVDYDLLGRYTYLTPLLRYDLLAGMTVRDGTYYTGSLLEWQHEATSVGIKLGGAVTIMVIRPVFALRLKGSAFFFGYKPIEAGAIGLGLVVGWQRDWDSE